MIEVQKYLEGQTVDDRYPLIEFLGSTQHSSVFRTECSESPSRNAAVKLISAPAATSGARLTRWRLAARCSHPALLRIYDMGRCEIENRSMLYIVTELAEENLAEVLRVRCLSPGEVSALLEPATDALACLHTKGFVHGRLNPSNIFAIGDQVKLSADSIARIGEAADFRDPDDPYCAPEVSRSAASDVWSLGAIIGQCLSGRFAERNAGARNSITVPTSIPAPFFELARHCLNPVPQRRWTVAQIRAALGQATVSASADAPKALTQAEPTTAPTPESAFAKSTPVAKSGFRLSLSPRKRLALAALAAGVAAFVFGVVISGNNADRVATQASPVVALAAANLKTVPASKQNSAAIAAKSESKSARPTLVNKAASIPPVHVHDSNAALIVTSAAPAAPVHSPEAASPASAAGNVIPGAVSRQAVPRVPVSASDTIHGTVRVNVIVDVDSRGRVVEAKLHDPGPSRYFARLSMAAANDWKFAPPRVDGAIVPSEWMIDFGYTSSGVSATAAEKHP